MRAVARLVAEADRAGRTRLTLLHGEPPLLLRQSGAATGEPGAQVYVIGGAAGPLAGDDLRLDIKVGPGASLSIRSAAASVAQPGRPGAASRTRLCASIGAEAQLRWLPEQLVGAAGCSHQATAEVAVASGGRLIWRDELVCGRHGETPGDVVVDTSIEYAGRPLLRQRLAVGPGADGWAGPAVLGGARCTGSLLVLDPRSTPPAPATRSVCGPTAASGDSAAVRFGDRPTTASGDSAARLPLATGPAVLYTAIAPDAHTLRQRLDPASWS